MSSDISNIVNCLVAKNKQLEKNIKKIKQTTCNESWFLEVGTGPYGDPTYGPFEVKNRETVRLWSDTIGISAEEGSVLVRFDGLTGGAGPSSLLSENVESGAIDPCINISLLTGTEETEGTEGAEGTGTNVGWNTKISSLGDSTLLYTNIDSKDNIYNVGLSSEGTGLINFYDAVNPSLELGPPFGVTGSTGDSNKSLFLSKYNPDGKIQWVTSIYYNPTETMQTIKDEVTHIISKNDCSYVSFETDVKSILFYDGITEPDSSSLPFSVTGGTGNNFVALNAKYDSNGKIKWISKVKSENVSNNGYLNTTTSDSQDNLIISGRVEYGNNILIYDGTTGTQMSSNKIEEPSSTYQYHVKYGPTGSVKWHTHISGVTGATGSADGTYFNSGKVLTDTEDNVYVSTYTRSNYVKFFDGATGTTDPTMHFVRGVTGTADEYNGDGYITKYKGVSGKFEWTALIGGCTGLTGPNGKLRNGITILDIINDNSNNIYAIGSCSYELIKFYDGIGPTGNLGSPLEIAGSPNLEPDVFIIKYDSNGKIKWVNKVGGNDKESPVDSLSNITPGITMSIVLDSKQENLFMLNRSHSSEVLFYDGIGPSGTLGNAYTMPGSEKIPDDPALSFVTALSKYSTEDGKLIWLNKINGSMDGSPKGVAYSSILNIDRNDNIYVYGNINKDCIDYYDTIIPPSGGLGQKYTTCGFNSSSSITIPAQSTNYIIIYDSFGNPIRLTAQSSPATIVNTMTIDTNGDLYTGFISNSTPVPIWDMIPPGSSFDTPYNTLVNDSGMLGCSYLIKYVGAATYSLDYPTKLVEKKIINLNTSSNFCLDGQYICSSEKETISKIEGSPGTSITLVPLGIGGGSKWYITSHKGVSIK